jgi:Histidine phosphatase superfamily (branch 2)
MNLFVLSFLLLNSFQFSTCQNYDKTIGRPKDTIKTLKLLQIIHRHGERNPLYFPPKDPFNSETYFPGGLGQLTLPGKYRLYQLGEYIRREYGEYLGSAMSPREVYTQSSYTNRTMESAQCLNAGAYPPGEK